MKERREYDQNQKNRMVKLWITIAGIVFVLAGFIAAGAVKINQVDRNKEDIEVMEVEQKEQGKILIKIDTNVENIQKDIDEIKDDIKEIR